MKYISMALLSSFFALTAFSRPTLSVGDILLQPLDCWACDLIEAEENTIYSHMGVVISDSPILVAEAYGNVRAMPLQEFTAKTEKGQRIAVIRLKDAKLLKKFTKKPASFSEAYHAQFHGKQYDPEFLWHNYDDSGAEKLYCSEMISKLYEGFLGITMPLKRMHFDRNREGWSRYFQGKVPDGELGNSPGDFMRSELFLHMGEL